MKKEKVCISILLFVLICFSVKEGKDSVYFEIARVLLVCGLFSGVTASLHVGTIGVFRFD